MSQVVLEADFHLSTAVEKIDLARFYLGDLGGEPVMAAELIQRAITELSAATDALREGDRHPTSK